MTDLYDIAFTAGNQQWGWTWPTATVQGWQCPVCKAVYAPSMPTCMHCGPKKTETTAGTKTENSLK